MLAAIRSTFATVAVAALFATPAAAQSKAATIGVGVVEIPPAYRLRTGYAGPGVFVAFVVPDSPAEGARILPGDVLSGAGGSPLTTPAQFYALTSAAAPGVPLTLALSRYGRQLTVSLAPAGVDELYAAPPACRRSEADAAMSASIAAGRRHDPGAETSDAARALDLYESCAAVNGILDEHTLTKSGDALLSQAVARVSQADRPGALPFAENAIAIYSLAAHSGLVSPDNKQVVLAKIGAIQRAFPELRGAPPDDSIALGLRTLTESQTASPFSVLGTWSSPASDDDTMVHLRVDLHPEHEAHFFARGFKITITSRYIGPQAIYALDAPPAENSGGGLLRNKSDVDPREDFRIVRRVDLGPGERKVYVLSFLVPSDSEFSGAADTIQYAPP